MLKYRLLCNTTFTVSNLIGPREEITLTGNPVKYIRPTSSSLPHVCKLLYLITFLSAFFILPPSHLISQQKMQAITMHMMSYAGNADMQILVAKDIIPDPKVLAKCFEDSLLDLKAAAEAALSDHERK